MANTMHSETNGRKWYTGNNLTDRGFNDSTSGGYGYSDTALNKLNSAINANKLPTNNNNNNNNSTRTYTGTTTNNNAADAYSALLAAYRGNDYSDYLAQARAAAQAAYDRGMSALNDAYGSQMNSLRNNLAETRKSLLNNYNYSRGNIGRDAEDSLRQAYINRMQSERNLGQQMAAQGLSGGATETTLANMYNNYGNARNDINTQANRSYADLENNYNTNLSQAMQAYNSAVANADLQKAQQAIQLENALSNNQISALSDYQTLMQRENQNYLDLLKTAIANGANFAYTPTSANNAVQGVAVQQASMPTANTNYAALQALLNAQQTPGSGAAVSLANPTVDNNYLAQILAQLGAR